MVRKEHEADHRLVQDCLSGDEQAWKTFIGLWGDEVRRIVRMTVRVKGVPPPESEIDDIAQEVLLSIVSDDFSSLRSFEWRCSLAQWMKAVVVNQCSLYLRRRIRREKHEVAISFEQGDERILDALKDGEGRPGVRLEEEEARRLFKEAFRKLPAQERIALRLFYWRGSSYAEMARLLRTTPEAVKHLLVRAREKLSDLVLK
jgi:RNA polymerase sigma factor (sigma-70 family)